MSEFSKDSISGNKERNVMLRFIVSYKHLSELWDSTDKNYSRKDKRLLAYQKLLVILKELKHDATITDVRKKINVIRSNYRKEWRKVYASNKNYKSSSWQFYELRFLNKSEKQNEDIEPSTIEIKHENIEKNTDSGDVWEMSDNNYVNVSHQYVRNERLSNSNQLQSFDDHQDVVEEYDSSNQCFIKADYELNLAKIWAAKLKSLTPEQRLFTEKAINDVLFEAQLKNLNMQFNQSN